SPCMLDCIRLYDDRVAYATDVPTRTQFSDMACNRTRLLSHDCFAVLVADSSTLPPGPTNATLVGDSISVSRRFSKYCSLGIPGVLRAFTLSGLRECSAHQRNDCARGSGGSRRNHVGGQLDLFPSSSWLNY